MSWASKLKKAAKKVKKAVNKAADKIADVIETAGNKAQEAAKKLGNDIRDNVPIIGPAAGAVVRWAGAITSGVMDIAGTAVKAAGSTIGGALAGTLLVLGGMIKDGILTALTEFVGGVLLVIGKFISIIQIAFGAEKRKRPLTEKEVFLLNYVFHKSVALYNVRVIDGASGVFDFNDRPFTMGNTIYMKRTPASEWNHSLVHETTHVWQYQNLGSSYASDALGAQQYYEHVRDTSAYDWWDPRVNGGNLVWEEWNREAQARFIEDVWINGESSTGGQPFVPGDGRFYGANGATVIGRFLFNGTNFTPVADDAVLALRGEVSVRSSLGMI